VPTLERLSTPAAVTDAQTITQAQLAEAWSNKVREWLTLDDRPSPHLYDPCEGDTPEGAVTLPIPWFAFPGRREIDDAELVDGKRDEQDEYCEWSVLKVAGAITKVTFTTELPNYFELLHSIDREAVLALYRENVNPEVRPEDLVDPDGRYDKNNVHNTQADGAIMHLRPRSNTLPAAINLVRAATFLRTHPGGTPVNSKAALVRCAGLGDEERNSDPKIATEVNALAENGMRITLADPVGIYITGLGVSGMTFPDGLSKDDCWHVERGTPGHTVRASFSVPKTQRHGFGRAHRRRADPVRRATRRTRKRAHRSRRTLAWHGGHGQHPVRSGLVRRSVARGPAPGRVVCRGR
jgi:hypothetical protein